MALSLAPFQSLPVPIPPRKPRSTGRNSFRSFEDCCSLPPSLLLFPPSRLTHSLSCSATLWAWPPPPAPAPRLRLHGNISRSSGTQSFSPTSPAPSQLHPADSKATPARESSHSFPTPGQSWGPFLSPSAWGIKCKTSALKRPSVGQANCILMQCF